MRGLSILKDRHALFSFKTLAGDSTCHVGVQLRRKGRSRDRPDEPIQEPYAVRIKPYLTKETKGDAHTGALGSLDNTIPFRDEKLLADAKSVGQKQLT